ncbi:metallophosphoesterase [Neobacillus cucumis]|uniref:Uncharacterized protein n=1 Tax=Neobacillus cucumis TaxID=1740721 RepID=A0A2N5HIU0_9BACI|nr:metallophosphoesterase [Neobacillus cucumis]PLS05430.1 hypothetical protein CVD27_10565 [Neobacillus cucumis]
MLIFISDLHLMDHTAGRHQLEAATFRDIFKELGYQAQEAVSPFEPQNQEIIIVLLGDIFDLIRTESWFFQKNTGEQIDLKDRPWGNPSKKTEEIANDILNNIIKENEEIFSILAGKEWKTLGFPKKPEIMYLQGNHDRLCNVYPSLREKVINILDLKDQLPSNPFPNYLKAEEYGVYARHGHEWDPFNFEGDYLTPSNYFKTPIGDVIASEIASKLPIEVGRRLRNTELPEKDVIQICNNFRNLFDVRPLSAIIPWLSFQVQRYEKYGENVQQAINAAFRQIGDEFMEIPFVKDWIKRNDQFWNPLDQADLIQILGTVLKNFNVGNSEGKLKLFEKLNQLKGLWSQDQYLIGAKKDFETLSSRYSYVLYGHTHIPFQYPIDVLMEKGSSKPTEQVYLNTGTWRPSYFQSLTGRGFTTWNHLTFTTIYKPGEIMDGQVVHTPTFNTWTGYMKKV